MAKNIDNVLFLFLFTLMQAIFSFRQAINLRSIQERLAVRFGSIQVEDRPDPVSQFVGSFIGTRTYDRKSWDAPVADIEAALEGVTFPEKKAPELKQALRAIRKRFGQINLDFLAKYDVDQALNCLKKIHGVSSKIASENLNFSTLRMRTLVVDTHVCVFCSGLGL
jgi:endonuclease III